MKKCVIFDMDGVIIDSEPLHTKLDLKILKEFGVEIEAEVLDQYIGCANKHTWKELIRIYELDTTLDEMLVLASVMRIQNLLEEEIEPIEGILPLLDLIKSKQLLLAVASSSQVDYIHAVLDKFNIRNYFDVIVSGDHVTNTKPAPDIFLKVASLLGVTPSECIVIEDSTHGVNAAKSAGMACIGYDNISSKNQDISLADYQVNSIVEIVQNFESMMA